LIIFLFYILPILFLVGLSFGTAYLVLLIDQSIEKDVLNEENKVEIRSEEIEIEKVTLSL